MPSFNSLKDLEAYIKNTVIPDILQKDVAPEVVKTEQRNIETEVYKKYKPKVYPNIEEHVYRRKYDGGLIAEKNIKCTPIGNDTISITNETEPNPYARDGASVNKNLADLIEFGEGGSDGNSHYDYTDPLDDTYLKPRPFTAKTVEELQNTKQHVKVFKDGLKNRYHIDSL